MDDACPWDPDELERVAHVPSEAERIKHFRAKALARATALLTPDRPISAPYPIDALGPLAPAAQAISEHAQVAPAMAGQSVLAVAAMLTQHTANIRGLDPNVKPLSLYCLTIAESGDGKSTADTLAQSPVQARQRSESRAYDAALRHRDPKEDAPPPPEPYRVARDGTVEGIRRGFAMGIPSQGCFSSEAAAMLAGYGMNPDNRAKSAATFNALWDDGEVSVSRAGAGRLQLYDRRLSIHWLIQPDAAQEAMSDPLLSNIGFWPRFLLAWPDQAPPRKARPWDASMSPALADYTRACNRLLDIHLSEDCADLPDIAPSAEAMDIACRFFERMEVEAKKGSLRDIKPYAVRATEVAFRVAGVLTAFTQDRLIDAGTMRDAIRLATYSLDCWQGAFGDRDQVQARVWALRMIRWLIDQPETRASPTAMLQIGPKALRSRSARDTAVSLLEQAGLVRFDGGHWYVNGMEGDR